MKGPFAVHISLILASLLVSTSLPASDFYKWTDENGAIHFSDSLDEVPESQRPQVTGGSFEKNQHSDPTEAQQPAKTITPEKKQERQRTSDSLPRYVMDYTAFEGQTSRVIIDVTFNNRVTVPMILDTGAGEVIISEKLAERLGLYDSDQAKVEVSVSGFGGTAPAIRTILDTMSMGELNQRFIPTRIVPDLSDAFYGVIGMNFMSNYQVRIDPRKQKVLFESLPSTVPTFAGRNKRWWQGYFSEFTRYRNNSKQRVAVIKQFLQDNKLAILKIRRAAKKALAASEVQYDEAEKLLAQLHRHASQNAVPMNWRRRR